MPSLAQHLLPDTSSAVSYTRAVGVPMNAFHLFDKAMDAWTWTFGKEPGAALRRMDRENGIIEGVARINFRSEMLVGREASMGVIAYRVQVQVRPGESRISVGELAHTGNRDAQRGGVHLGLLTRSSHPPQRVHGLGRANVERLYAEVKERAHGHIMALMQAYEARLRANLEP